MKCCENFFSGVELFHPGERTDTDRHGQTRTDIDRHRHGQTWTDTDRHDEANLTFR